LEKRIELFLEDLKLEEGKETVLVISHGGPIMAMVNKLSDKKLRYPESSINNGEIIEFDLDTNLEF
jgi:broad specificity phosphatase PhoE